MISMHEQRAKYTGYDFSDLVFEGDDEHNYPGLWPVFSWIVLEKLRAWNRAHPKLAACHAECVSVCVSVCPAESASA